MRERMATVRTEHESAESEGGQDDGDLSEGNVREDINVSLVRLQRETLDRIDLALGRLEHGLYGYCLDCGDEIAAVRLRVMPFAVRCVECETAREADRLRNRSREGRSRPFAAARHLLE
jgi:DnaK suppressor protein